MPGRGRSTFNKRQKEISRQEKRREKAARKQQRRLEKQAASLESSEGSRIPDSPDAELSHSPSDFESHLDLSQRKQ